MPRGEQLRPIDYDSTGAAKTIWANSLADDIAEFGGTPIAVCQ